MGFTDAIRSGFSNYVTFSGRAPRSEFWYWALFVFVASFILGIVDGALFGGGMGNTGPLGLIFSLAVLLPGIAVSVRRMHDLDRTGWWVLLWIIPVVGWIILLIFCVMKGSDGANSYGPDPLAAAG